MRDLIALRNALFNQLAEHIKDCARFCEMITRAGMRSGLAPAPDISKLQHNV
jgi:hypothetical protein